MKLIYVVIDGMGDLPIKELGNKTPLGAAETPNMDNLARNGKTGLMYTVKKGIAPESDVGVVSILGYDPFKYATGRGILEAIGAGINVNNGDLALRCNFATLGEGKTIIDRRAGRDLTNEEGSQLSEAINRKVKLQLHPADFEFKNTIGYRSVLVIRSREGALSARITNTDPAYERVQEMGVAKQRAKMILNMCEPMDGSEKTKNSAALVNEFVQKSQRVLEEHQVNKHRAARGKLKANIILTRDAGSTLPKFFNIGQEYHARFACLADMPVERGIATLAGMSLANLPPPTPSLKEDCLARISKLLKILHAFDCFYIHIKGPDEPGHDGNFRLKQRMIEEIDRHFFGSLQAKIDLHDYIVCVTADHATPCSLKGHSDDPVPLLVSGGNVPGDGVRKFSEKECRNGSLGTLKRGTQLMPLLMNLLGKP